MSDLDIVGDFLAGTQPPLPGYRFVAVVVTGDTAQSAPLDMRFQKISGLKITRDLRDDRDDFLLKPAINRRDLVLERGLTRQPTELEAVHQLEQDLWNSRLLQSNILLVLLSDEEKPNPIRAWMVHKAFLTSLEWGDFNGEENTIMIESMTYSYSSLSSVKV